MIDTAKFRRFMQQVQPTEKDIKAPNQKLLDRQYMQRVGLAELIFQAGLIDSGLTVGQKLKVAAKLSQPEVQTNPQRWAVQFEEMSEEEKAWPALATLWALASDLCAMVPMTPPVADAECDEPDEYNDLEDKGAAA